MHDSGHMRGILAMLLAVASFSLMDAQLKLLAGHYGPLQVAFLRGATSLPFGGALPSGRRTATDTDALSRTLSTCRSGVTLTASSCAAQPTLTSASPIRNDGFARSTIAVGAGSAIRPRTSRADTNTLGA